MRRLLAFVLATLARNAGAQDCSTLGQNQTMYQTMNDWYYWYKNMRAVSPATFADAEAMLDVLRYRPLDTTFSYITTASSSQAYYGDSQYMGFGFSTKFTVGYELRVTEVFPASFAAALTYLTTGACPAAASVKASSERREAGPAARAHDENGWQALRVAY